jgi:GntR family transcriptional regulator
MLIEIDHHIGVPIYRQIIRQVRRQIMTDGLAEGDQLEAVRNLAARLKVNPMTISKAYSFLEAEGLVERRRGIGLFVIKAPKSKKDRIKKELLDDAVGKAAATAIQLGVSESEVMELLRKRYKAYMSKKRRGK